MIDLYSGTPGSGKSYHACDRVYYAIMRGQNVIANFPVRFPNRYKKRGIFAYWNNSHITPDNLILFSKKVHTERKEHQTILIIDEAGVVFNSRTWQDANRLKWINFFSQHRKLGYDVILIAQSDVMIDKQIREFIETEHNHRKVSSCGAVGFFLQALFNFADVKSYYSNKMRIGCDFMRYRQRIGNLYDTFRMFG